MHAPEHNCLGDHTVSHHLLFFFFKQFENGANINSLISDTNFQLHVFILGLSEYLCMTISLK